jgi:hypothetical protein
VRSDEGFTLFGLRNARVGVWPVPAASLDDRSARWVSESHQTHARLLDDMGDRFSKQLLRYCRRGSLGSDAMVKLLVASPGTSAYLDPAAMLGRPSASRFTSAETPDLAGLRDLEALHELRYAIVFRELAMGVRSTVFATAGQPFGGMMVDETAEARLRLAVVDLEAQRVVWEGMVYADTGTWFDAATVIEELERGLVDNFMVKLGVTKTPRYGASR